MKTKINSHENCVCCFEVEIPPDTIDRAFQEVYREIKQYARIPGFRVGSAPQDLLEKHHGVKAREEVLKRLIPDGYRDFLSKKNINPVSMPVISDVKFDKDNSLSFSAKVEVRPVIKLKKYTKIKIKSRKVAVIDDEIDDTIKRLQEMHAQYEPVAEKRAVKRGEYTLCDIEAFIDEKPITKKHENMWVEANKESSMLGVGEHLIGAMAGDSKDINLKLPESYPDKKYAGKDALFKVTIKEIKNKVLPTIDNDFAKDIGAESLNALRINLAKEMKQKKDSGLKNEMKSQLLDRLLTDYPISVPPSMTQRQYEIIMKHLEEDLLSKGLHKDAVSDKKKEYDAQVRKDAADKVKIYFILDAIAVKENIKVRNEDMENRFDQIAKMSKQDVQTVKNYYETNDLIDGLLEQLREEKTLDWLLGQADVTIAEADSK